MYTALIFALNGLGILLAICIAIIALVCTLQIVRWLNR